MQTTTQNAPSKETILEEIIRHEEIMALERARKGLLAFTLTTFPDYEVNWHHYEVCKVLNRFAAGKIKRLIVCMPPRHGKSQLVSRQLPAFILGQNPRAKIIATSYSADLASMMNRDVQRIIDSKRYREIFPQTVLNSSNTRTLSGAWMRNSDVFETVGYGGVYRSAGVGGGITGQGGNFIIVDDPIKNREEADSLTYREKLWHWYTSTLYTRLEKEACILITVTRWHEDDLVGRLLALAKADPKADQWGMISLPAIAEGKTASTLLEDPREIDEPLWPNKYSLERLAVVKASLGTRDWNALFQQRPAPDAGMIIKKDWWQYYLTPPPAFDQVVQSWDLAFTGSKTSDFVVGVVLGKVGANIYLLDMVRDRLTFTESIAAIKRLTAKWPNATAKYVEQAANGFALIDSLKKEVGGLIPVKPTSSKVSRVNSVSPGIEAGNLYLPSPSIAPWVQYVVDEWTNFPAGTNDDIVDAMSQGITKLATSAGYNWAPISMTGTNTWKY